MKALYLCAFSIIELLVVIAIVAILLAATGPALSGLLESGRVAQAATLLTNQLTIGRFKAIAENRPISLRIIRKDASSSFDRLQLVGFDSKGNVTVAERVATLPTGTTIAQSSDLSSLLAPSSNPEVSASSTDPIVPGLGTNYRYVEITFRPRGSLNLDISKKWFATVMLLRSDQSNEVPSNFTTIQIDPVNGGVRYYRP